MATRTERVVLEVEDHLAAALTRDAAAAALLNRELSHLSGNAVQTSRTTRQVERDIDKVGETTRRSGNDIDKFSGRLGILIDAGLAIGPAFAPIGAVAIPGVTGLTSSLGFAVTGVGVAVLAFQGIGDTLKAVNKAALEPTTENLMAAHAAMAQLSPDARGFVRELRSLQPELKRLEAIAGHGLFTGLQEGIHGLLLAAPQVETVVSAISKELGDISADAGKSLGGENWDEFLTFIGTEGPHALSQMAHAAGNTVHAMAALWMSTTPLNNDFLDYLVDATRDLDAWATRLGSTDGFHEFTDFVETTGPEVGQTIGSIANALVQVADAAAPLGGPTLRIIEDVADAVAAIADSPIGTPLVAIASTMATLRLATRGYEAVQARTWGSPMVGKVKAYATALTTVTTAQERATMSAAELQKAEAKRSSIISSGNAAIGKNLALVAGLTVASSGLADSMGLSNTASLALAGAFIGPEGAVAGGLVGAFLDASSASHTFDQSLRTVEATIASGNINQITEQLKEVNDQLDDAQHHKGLGDSISDSTKEVFNGNWVDKAKAIPVVGGWIGTFAKGKDQVKGFKDEVDGLQDALSDRRSLIVQQELNAGFRLTAAGIDTATQSAEDFQQALDRVNNVLTGRASLRDYEEALDTFTESLKKNGQTLDTHTEKGRANQAALDSIATTAAKVAESIQNPGRRAAFLDNARSEFIKAATAAGMTKKAARDLADQVVALNQVTGTPKVRLNSSDFDAEKASIDTWLAAITGKTHTITIGVNVPNVKIPKGYDQGLGNGLLGPLQGPKPKHPHKGAAGVKTPAYGGYISGPGGPRDDQIPAWLSNGEYVMPADAVDYYGVDALDGMRLKKFAGGGAVDGRRGGLDGYIRNQLHMDLPHGLKEWNRALSESAKVVNKEKDARQSLIDQRDQLKSTLTDAFRSDLFTQPTTSSVWMSSADRQQAGIGDVFSTLTGNIDDATAYRLALKKIKGQKLIHGSALAALAASGNIDQVQAFATGSAADQKKYEQLFDRRQTVTAGLGGFANEAFGSAIAAHTATLKQISHENAALRKEVAKLEKHLHHAAPRRRP